MPLPMGPLVGLGMRTLLTLLLALIAVPAFAQSDEDVAESVWTRGGVIYATQVELCMAALGSPGTQPYTRYEMRGTAPGRALDCYRAAVGGGDFIYAAGTETCPSGFSAGSGAGHQHCHRPTSCAAKAGQSQVMNFTVGWARSNIQNANDLVSGPTPPPGTGCDGGCVFNLGGIEEAWRSQRPAANGLHRISADYRVTWSGAACQTGPTTPNDPNAPPPPCPGFTGRINGHPVCVGTPTTPLPQNPRAPGTPPEGPGNPAAGPMPTTGPGSGAGPGRTPTVGDGGNAGGNGNAAVPGGGSDGNGQGDGSSLPTNPDGSTGGGSGSQTGEPTEIETCGLPGKPPCKFDETGTPTGDGAYGDATNAVNQNKDSAVQGINDAAGTAGKATGWTFTFALPSGCSEVPLAAFAPYISGINVCTWQGVIHDLMSMIWLAVTVWCCIGMVGRAIGGGN